VNYNRKIEEYKKFIRLNGLALIRASQESIQRLIRYEVLVLQSDPTNKHYLIYLNQFKFDTLFDSDLVEQWVKSNQNISPGLRLPLSKSWIKHLSHDLSLNLRNLKKAKFKYSTKILALQCKSLVRIFFIIFPFNSLIRLREFDFSTMTYVIDHTKAKYGDGKAKTAGWDYGSWVNKKSATSRQVIFLSQVEFFQVLLSNQILRDKFCGLKLKYIIFKDTLRDLLESDLRISDGLLILDQIFFSKVIKHCTEDTQGLVLQFTESVGCRRPIWTYEAEKRGIGIEFQFFANYATLSLGEKSEVPPQFLLYSWSKISVVSAWQAKSVPGRNLLDEAVYINKSEVPWFRDCIESRSPKAEDYIAVFNYEPKKGIFGHSTLVELGLSTEDCTYDFLQPIIEICSSEGIKVFHKPKRIIPNRTQVVNVQKVLRSESGADMYTRIDPCVSPHRLISGALGVISLPPTTTGLIGYQMNTPSVYFDPYGKVYRNDPSLEGVNVINSKEELEIWIKSLRKKF
jgi:hypothetical protein